MNPDAAPRSSTRLDVLRDMVIFVEVGRRRNFTRAAKALGLPLSTLARRISVLEEELGMRLVERTTRQLSLTADGRRYFERCQNVVDDALAAYDDVRAQSRGLDGLIRVSTPSELGTDFLADIIVEFLSDHPGLQIDMELGNNETGLGDRLDLAIHIGEPNNQALVTRKIGLLSMGLYASAGYLDTREPIESRSSLKDHPLLICTSCTPYFRQLVLDIPRENINFGGRLTCDSFELAASLAASDAGIAFLPMHLVERYIASTPLRRVMPTWTAARIPLFAVMTSKLLPLRTRTFLLFVAKRFRSRFGAEGSSGMESNGLAEFDTAMMSDIAGN